MPDKNVVSIFSRVHETPAEEVAETGRYRLLDSPLTNDELLDPLLQPIKCVGALSVVAEMNSRIKSLRTEAHVSHEL